MIDKILECFPEEGLEERPTEFDEAIIGVDESSMRLIYSVSKCIDVLLRDMDYDDAIEHFNFNIGCAYVGKKTPIWCFDNF